MPKWVARVIVVAMTIASFVAAGLLAWSVGREWWWGPFALLMAMTITALLVLWVYAASRLTEK